MTTNNIDLPFAKAYALHQNEELTQAISAYKALLTLCPHHLETLHCLGVAYVQLGKIPEAIGYFKQALKQNPEDMRLHNHLGNAYKALNQFDEAIHHYEKALQLDPEYAQGHNNLATIYALQNHTQKALEHYKKAVHAAPDFAAAHYNLGLLFLKNNQLTAAEKQFENVVSLNPNHSEARAYLGTLQLQDNRLREAEHNFQAILSLNNEHVDALNNMGVIAMKREQGQIAIDFFTKALALDNSNLEARNNLAATFMHHDRFENALMHYAVLQQNDPDNLEYLYNSGVAQMALGYLQEAKLNFEKLLTLQTHHFAALNNLAAIEIRQGNTQHAIALLKRAIAANPNDETSQFMLQALTGNTHNPKPCATYVNNLFNNYALYYDQHMQNTLQYTLPQHIGRLLHQLHCLQVPKTIDLGCGTGLTGIVLCEISEHLTGVDISHNMLAQARQKNIYDTLVEQEALTYLLENPALKYDLVVAADVLPYLGELESLFTAVSQQLNPEGMFLFTHEISNTQPFQLQTSARFSHQSSYVKSVCNALALHILSETKITARQQNHRNVDVMLYAVTKNLGLPSARSTTS